jgi:hypothetical protein
VLAHLLAEAPRFLAPFLGKIALRLAVFDAKALGIADARRRRSVPDDQHLTATAQQRPQRLVRGGLQRREDQRHEEGELPHRPSRVNSIMTIETVSTEAAVDTTAPVDVSASRSP